MELFDITFINANGHRVVVQSITAEYVEAYKAFEGITEFTVIEA